MTTPMGARKKLTRRVETAGSVVAGGAGASFGAAKLRDTHVAQYGKTHVHTGAKALAHVVPPRTAVKLATRNPGFKTLAIGSAAGAVAAAADHYGDHLTRKQKKMAAQAKRDQVAKADWGQEMGNIPRAAHLKGIGRVRVLGYHGNNRFRVLDRTDSERIVHRDKLTFTKPKGTPVSKSAFLEEPIGKALDRRQKTTASLGVAGGAGTIGGLAAHNSAESHDYEGTVTRDLRDQAGHAGSAMKLRRGGNAGLAAGAALTTAALVSDSRSKKKLVAKRDSKVSAFGVRHP